MDVETAAAIIGEAKSRKIIDVDMPPDEAGKISLAEQVAKNARAAVGKAHGEAAEAVNAIISLLEDDAVPVSEPEPIAHVEHVREAKSQDSVRIANERLPIPPEIEGELPVLPIDISALTDGQLRKLFGMFNACAQRAKWVVVVEEGKEEHARRIADNEYAVEFLSLEKNDSSTGKSKLSAQLEAEANAKASVKEWRDKQYEHHENVRKLKALRDSYESSCDRISREWSMRSESWQKDGGLRGRG